MGMFGPSKRDQELDEYFKNRPTYIVDGKESLTPNGLGWIEKPKGVPTNSIKKKINGYSYNLSPDDDPQPFLLKAILWFGFLFILLPLILIRLFAGLLMALH